jgi:heterodisulfide reductase subunit C
VFIQYTGSAYVVLCCPIVKQFKFPIRLVMTMLIKSQVDEMLHIMDTWECVVLCSESNSVCTVLFAATSISDSTSIILQVIHSPAYLH